MCGFSDEGSATSLDSFCLKVLICNYFFVFLSVVVLLRCIAALQCMPTTCVAALELPNVNYSLGLN